MEVNINIFFFGQLVEITGMSSLKMTGISETDDLKSSLQQHYPALKNLTYSIAINRQVIQKNTSLKSRDEVALLPPFSGG